MKSIAEAFAYIDSFTNFEMGITPEKKRLYRLDRMRNLLALFNNPQNSFKSIHIAGTKGKGSTAALLANVLTAAGKKTGLFMSPHVSSPLERISVPGWPLNENLFTETVNDIKEKIDTIRENEEANVLFGLSAPTTFELLVLTAFLYFQKYECGYAVIETGIGGRLDATNIIQPDACIITPIDLEHTDILGSTIEKIAAEKAGIIKKGVPIFCGFQPPAVERVIRRISLIKEAQTFFLKEEVEFIKVLAAIDGTEFSIRLKRTGNGGNSAVRQFRLSLTGDFQAENAALVFLTIKSVYQWITDQAFARGFRNTFLPGRFEITGKDKNIVLDGAHTPLSVERLLETYLKLFPEKGILIFGSVKGKNHAKMAEILSPHFRRIIISRPGTFKESSPEEVYSSFKSLFKDTELIINPGEALSKALRIAELIRQNEGITVPILVTGSFYMVAPIRLLIPLKNQQK
ncbi:MAG: bifunctional folylpolyglutamate synthase/dihydrofolate synthase [Spirochaetales bacterium]|nr:bifunctional folylpolyglutamate synthase/dihydrofolate synthase [Spirochaetales bacterium]